MCVLYCNEYRRKANQKKKKEKQSNEVKTRVRSKRELEVNRVINRDRSDKQRYRQQPIAQALYAHGSDNGKVWFTQFIKRCIPIPWLVYAFNSEWTKNAKGVVYWRKKQWVHTQRWATYHF